MDFILAILMVIIGAGIPAYWLNYWASGRLPLGFRTIVNGSYIVFHILAELVTAGLCLAAGAVIVFHGFPQARALVFLASGALIYAGVNSLGWSSLTDHRMVIIFLLVSLIAVAAALYAQTGWQQFG
ncbi:hypothetical protein [Dehalogenimonas alkenigignens]|uniref:DUF8058 domain-containing protein n=1 Tax=Dehalogenimonas alkenigignens TaxID=1217799 RepID=A0A0W0GGB5_9CHLR|nr:hypothetical protein [Dehalogenimonas alkenigignens]KTB47602.1 hypothetical protein DEALK_04470 [Dehalogenimonas alkenigignens]PVV82857.1 hypothetical protein DD509_07640 [Dehalogenimonas alkenigignens]